MLNLPPSPHLPPHRAGARRLFFSAGEPSGDLHGANLIRELRAADPEIECVGYGGPKMAEAGCQLHADLTALAVMWIARVLVNLHKFLHLVSRADRFFRHERPDAVILIDYPGFNWWIARRAKAHGIPVFYYAPPQVWAWARWRVKKMRRLVDQAFASLPFEARWLRERGVNAAFVGHPFFDDVRRHVLDAKFVETERQRGGRLITLLPGSRAQEVEHNLRDMLRVARRVHDACPGARFAIASFKPAQAEFARQLVASTGLDIEVHAGRTPELMAAADACLAVSGSVSLELLHHACPTVVLYRISPLAYEVQSWFRRARYITLVNLLASRDPFITPPAGARWLGRAIFRAATYDPDAPGAESVPMPEYLTCEDRTEAIASRLLHWLTDEPARKQASARLAELRAEFGAAGAARRAAELILAVLGRRTTVVPRPHYQPGLSVVSSGLTAPTAPAALRR